MMVIINTALSGATSAAPAIKYIYIDFIINIVHIRLALTYLWTIEAFGGQALLKVSLFTILFAGAFILNIKSESS